STRPRIELIAGPLTNYEMNLSLLIRPQYRPKSKQCSRFRSSTHHSSIRPKRATSLAFPDDGVVRRGENHPRRSREVRPWDRADQPAVVMVQRGPRREEGGGAALLPPRRQPVPDRVRVTPPLRPPAGSLPEVGW